MTLLEVRLAGTDVNLKLHDEVDTYYGFYEVHLLRAGNLVGELDINGYKGIK